MDSNEPESDPNHVNFGSLLLPYDLIQQAIDVFPVAVGIPSNLRCLICRGPCCEHVAVRLDFEVTFDNNIFTLTARGEGYADADPEPPVFRPDNSFNSEDAFHFHHQPNSYNGSEPTLHNVEHEYPYDHEAGQDAATADNLIQNAGDLSEVDPEPEARRTIATSTDSFEEELDYGEPDEQAETQMEPSDEPWNDEGGGNEPVAGPSNSQAGADESVGIDNENHNSTEHPRRRTHGRRKNRNGRRGRWNAYNCALCFSNKETEAQYTSHPLFAKGIVCCPVLRSHVCPICNATGDNAHTLRRCPLRTDTDTRRLYKPVRMASGKFYTLKY